ncbi:MAG TPA: hypothetical protein VFY17_07650 [Pilimelia sp.]|nr:hypothetical protein [Pilimelia sp.]
MVAQANPRMPVTGGDAWIDCAAVDHLIEVDTPLSTTAGAAEPDPVAATIGALAAELVPAEATLPSGIGAGPDATLLVK